MQRVTSRTALDGDARKVALLGGAYSNWLALEAAIRDARRRGVDDVWFLGDVGGFGPHPDRSVNVLREQGVRCVQGNYDDSVGHEMEDCACGYTDPRDNHFAQLSYDYTLAHTSADARRWLTTMQTSARLAMGDKVVHLCHGSPRKVNEFLWESTTPAPFIAHLCAETSADVIACTHTGIPWSRRLSDGRGVVNVGAIGRPPNNGRTAISYTLLEHRDGGLMTEDIWVDYDHKRLAREMRNEGLPEEFVETIETGWWTTCLEILPAKERSRGQH